jgi:hypothetical protein
VGCGVTTIPCPNVWDPPRFGQGGIVWDRQMVGGLGAGEVGRAKWTICFGRIVT